MLYYAATASGVLGAETEIEDRKCKAALAIFVREPMMLARHRIIVVASLKI